MSVEGVWSCADGFMVGMRENGLMTGESRLVSLSARAFSLMTKTQGSASKDSQEGRREQRVAFLCILVIGEEAIGGSPLHQKRLIWVRLASKPWVSSLFELKWLGTLATSGPIKDLIYSGIFAI